MASLHAMAWNSLQSRISTARADFRQPKNYEGSGSNKIGAAGKTYPGKLDAERNCGFAADYMEAIWLMRQQEPDDYVIATGGTNSVRDFVDEAFGYMQLDWKQHVEIDPRYYRPTEVDLLWATRLKRGKN